MHRRNLIFECILITIQLSMAPIIYTEEGKQISQRLWKETMKELAFANIEKVIAQAGAP